MRRATFSCKLRKPTLTQWTEASAARSCVGGPPSLPPRLATPAQKRVPRPTHSEPDAVWRWVVPMGVIPNFKHPGVCLEGANQTKHWRGKEESQAPTVCTKRYEQRSLSRKWAIRSAGATRRRLAVLRVRREDSADRLPPRGLMLLQHVHRPLQNGATVANACSQPSGWSVRLLATRPLGAHGDHVLWICGIFRQNTFDSEEYESCKEAELTVCKTTTMGSVCSAASREFGNNFLREPGRGGELSRVKPREVKSSPGLDQVKPRGNVRQT